MIPMNINGKKQLIINADGFGFTDGNNRAIFEVAAQGNISSISVTTNFAAINELPEFHRKYPSISIGVHLNPVVGHPVCDPKDIPSLVRPCGEFWDTQFARRLRHGQIQPAELTRELLAQIQVVADMGIPITHLDSHQNQHLRPGFFNVFLHVAMTTGIRRMRSHRHFVCAECHHPRISAIQYYAGHVDTLFVHAYTRWLMMRARRAGLKMADRLMSVGHSTRAKKVNLAVWRRLIRNIPPGVSEVYCHPGYPDETLRKYAQYVDERGSERKVLVSPQFRQLLSKEKVSLIGFQHI